MSSCRCLEDFRDRQRWWRRIFGGVVAVPRDRAHSGGPVEGPFQSEHTMGMFKAVGSGVFRSADQKKAALARNKVSSSSLRTLGDIIALDGQGVHCLHLLNL